MNSVSSPEKVLREYFLETIKMLIGQTGALINDNSRLQRPTLSFVSQERYVKKLQCDVLNRTIDLHQVLCEYNKG